VNFSPANFANVMLRLSAGTGASSDADLARLLGMSRSDFAQRKQRDKVPWDRVLPVAGAYFVSADWLLTGEGPMRRETPLGVAEGAHHYGECTGMAGPVPDPPELAQLIAAMRSWYAAADAEQRVWMRVQIRRAIPEIETYINSGDGEDKSK
jgi:hypothetical protein